MMSFAIIISLNLLSMIAWIFARALKKKIHLKVRSRGSIYLTVIILQIISVSLQKDKANQF